MSTTVTTNFVKPIAMAGCIIAGDKFLLGESDMNRSLYFGAAGAVGVFAAQMIAPNVPFDTYLPNGTYTDSKTLELRILEIGGAVGIGYVVNKFVLKNELYVNDGLNKVALLIGADVAAEFIDDYIAGKPLSFFK